jgi:hypothetical protein
LFAAWLPRSAFFEAARVVGSESELSFTLPAAIRAGVELHLRRVALRGGNRCRASSMNDEIDLPPHGVQSEGGLGVGAYVLGNAVIPREYWRSAISRASRGRVLVNAGSHRIQSPCSPGRFARAL